MEGKSNLMTKLSIQVSILVCIEEKKALKCMLCISMDTHTRIFLGYSNHD